MSECAVTTPPVVEADRVQFTVVHQPSGRAFEVHMADFDSVEVIALPADATPWADGEIRALVAERAKAYVREDPELFRELFEQIA